MSHTISREALQSRIASGRKQIIIEALPSQYFVAGHLPGAINIPHDEIERHAYRLVPDKNIDVIVYCASTTCQNSHIAATTLRSLGYRNVFEYREGKQDWKDAGLQLEVGGGDL